MATKTRCNCCATLFLGQVVVCKTCKLPCCAICKSETAGSCCKCAHKPCVRTASESAVESSMSSLSMAENSVPNPSLQDGWQHPVTLFGCRYDGVGPFGPELSEFEKDSRWAWKPYQNFVKHVYKHRTKQLSGAEYRELATYVTDYGIDSPGWNGFTFDNYPLSDCPHPNYYQPEPIAAFQNVLNAPKPDAMDPPDVLLEIKSAQASDPSNNFCYKAFWAPHAMEDPKAYPFSFATVGSSGIHFFNQEHVMAKEYRPSDPVTALAADIASESFIYLHESAKRVTVGTLTDPDDIVMEFDLPKDYAPVAVGVIKTQSGNRALIHGSQADNTNTVMVYDLETGQRTANVPIKRYHHEYKHPAVSRGAIQRSLVMDPVRTNVCYLGLLSEPGFAIVDTRMGRAARWIKLENEIKYLTVQPYGACDKLVYSTGGDVELYDLTAGKARYRHKTLGSTQASISAIGLASYGEQIALGHSDDGGTRPILSWLSWENFESGSYFATKKDSSIPGSGAEFLAVNSSGVYAMEHNHAMFAPWQSPIGGKPLVSQVKAPSATASGAAPVQKGVRRAKRETAADSFSEPVNIPAPTKPSGFTKEFNDYEGLPEINKTDRHYFSRQLWAAPGTEDPNKYPFEVMCVGSGGINFYDREYQFMGNSCKDGAQAVFPHEPSQKLVVVSEAKGVDIFDFRNLFDAKPIANASNLGYKPECVTVMNRTSAQIIVGGDQTLIFDMETMRRVSEINLEHGGRQLDSWGLVPDRSRPDVLYAMGLEQGFMVDLRVNSKSVRSFAPSKGRFLISLVPMDYGAYDKVLLTKEEQMWLFDVRSGKELVEVEGDIGPAANYGSTLCVGSYKSGISYYNFDNIAEPKLAESEVPSSPSQNNHSVVANWKGVYRKSHDRVYFYPFKGTKLN